MVSSHGLSQNRRPGEGVLPAVPVIFWQGWCMAKGYRPVDRDQPFLLPPDMREWLPPDHPVWLVIRVVEQHLDTSAFHAGRKAGGAGAAGYDPDMLLAVLVWAYANGVTSSRRMEQLCATDVAFRVIRAGNLPDHATIARFRAGFAGAVPVFFGEVLRLCARLGMGRLGTVALDGMKIAASASKSANRSGDKLDRLARDIVARHAEADAAEDELFGGGVRGDEVPEEAWRPRSRDERIAAALAEENLARARAARAAQIAELERRAGSRRDRPRAGIEDYCRVKEAAAKVDKARARAAEAARRAGQGTQGTGAGA